MSHREENIVIEERSRELRVRLVFFVLLPRSIPFACSFWRDIMRSVKSIVKCARRGCARSKLKVYGIDYARASFKEKAYLYIRVLVIMRDARDRSIVCLFVCSVNARVMRQI